MTLHAGVSAEMDDPHGTSARLDAAVRAAIYDGLMTECVCPSMADVGRKLAESTSAIRESYARLAAARVLVLQPGSGEVLMANPFSAVPTAFRVEAADRAWWGNCIWDALGVCAMTRADASIATSCPDCGDALSLRVERSELLPAEGIVHFAVPAANWWVDIVFT